MKQQNHEDTIMRAYVWLLHSNGETKEEAEKIALKEINNFKQAEACSLQGEIGVIGGTVHIDQLAEYVAQKYLTSLDGLVAEATSKKTLHGLEAWWQKHQKRCSMNLSEEEFNELAIKVMPRLFTKKKEGGDAVTPESEPVHELQQDCTALVVDINPKELAINDNFSIYAAAWREEMRKADFIPQDEAALKVIRANEKKCKEVEGTIDDILGEISAHLEEVGRTDPRVKAYTDKLVDNRAKLNTLKQETAAHRKNIAHAPKRYMNDQKDKAVKEHHARVKDAADQLFVGEIAKGRNDAGTRDRLVAAYKGKRTVPTIQSAVEEEAARIIEEMNDRAALCRSNLELIAASGRPALFQDQKTLMTWNQENLEQEITIRVQKDDLLKAQAVRKPEKLEEWKSKVNEIGNIPYLKNWYVAHRPEIESDLPHDDDRAAFIEHCGARKQQLSVEFAKSMNTPPPPESDNSAKSASTGPHQCDDEPCKNNNAPAGAHRQDEEREEDSEELRTHQSEDGSPKPIKLQLEFELFCTSEQAKKIGKDVYAMIGKNPMLQGDITLRRI